MIGRCIAALIQASCLVVISAAYECEEGARAIQEAEKWALLRLDRGQLAWRNDTMPCQGWEGIECNDQCRVNMLDLGEKSIAGHLPPEWSLLTDIKKIYLARNLITGPLPREWSSLMNIEWMILQGNGITGLVPPEWSSLSRIRWMYLDHNRITGPLPVEWSSMTSMERMFLNSNGVTGPLPFEWSSMDSIYWMILQGNSITGRFPPEWSSMTKMQWMYLDYNSITGSLPPEWSSMTSMERMYLSGNGISGPLPMEWSSMTNALGMILEGNAITGQLPLEWSSMTRLEWMHLNNNRVTGSLPAEWSTMRHAMAMLLNYNGITGSLPQEWASMTSLAMMELEGNTITGQLPLQWSSLMSLNKLHLNNNRITGTLPNEWSSMEMLQKTRLDGNYLAGSLPQDWSMMTNAVAMLLNNNSITGKLPPDWSSMTSLAMLVLEDNDMTGPLPAEWSSMTSMQWMYLNQNGLTGTLPQEWSMMTSIERIVLFSNFITGALPPEWSSMTNVARMALFGNSISGTLPPEWSSMRSVNKMVLYKNRISGRLPPEWASFSNIQILDLEGNRITGPLPAAWSAMRSIERMVIFNNSITGELPPEWSSLSSMQWLFLESNRISGPLPPAWSSLKALTRILLDNNDISGPLPREWSSMTQLSKIHLFNNSISGELPPEWSSMASLTKIYLLRNRITGPLPKQWSSITSVEWLVFGHNAITGTLPPEWSSLSSIEGLYLDHNNITGQLPGEWSSLMSIKLMCLMLNDITGTIPREWSIMTGIEWMVLEANRMTGLLPPEWSSLSKLQWMALDTNSFSGSLPPEWSSMTSIQWMGISNNAITGSLPSEWSSMASTERMSINSNHISGRLPREWSLMTKVTWMYLYENHIRGPLPLEWSSMTALTQLSINANRLTGTLPSQWSTMNATEAMDMSSNRLEGTLPRSWSSMDAMKRMLLSSNMLRGSLPESWSSMRNLAIMTLDSNQLSGTIPRQLIESALAVRERKVFGCPFEGLGPVCFGTYKTNTSFAAHLSVTSNRLSGKVIMKEDQRNAAGERIATADLADGLNCLTYTTTGQKQLFCPPATLEWYLLGALLGTLVVSCAANAIRFGCASSVGRRRPRSARAYLAETRRAITAPPWFTAALAAMAWSAFVVSPVFEAHVIGALKRIGVPDLGMVMARNLAVTLQPFAWGLVFLWYGTKGAVDRFSSVTASSWTMIASLDSLEENLAATCAEQRVLAGLFVVLVPLVSLLNLAALPATFNRWVPVPTPEHAEVQLTEPPVWMEIQVEVPGRLVAMFIASLLVVLYHAIACISLPAGVLTSTAIREACRPSAWAQSAMGASRQNLKSLFWLRQGGWALLASALIAATMLTTALALMQEPDTRSFDYYRDWMPFKDREAEGQYAPATMSLGRRHMWVTFAALVMQLTVATAWNVSFVGWCGGTSPHGEAADAGAGDENEAPDTRKGAAAERSSRSLSGGDRTRAYLWNRIICSRGHAQKSLCVAIIGLQMVPVLGAGHTAGWILVAVTWGASCALLAASLLVRECPATFDDLKGSPEFGLVIQASDLAAALAANLAEEGGGGDCCKKEVIRTSCCIEGAHAGGCGLCQRLLRRFPATMARMNEALAVSYRWQPDSQALLHPQGNAGPTDGVGLKDGVVGINMSRWQRERLLQAIEESGLPYVWLDVLSIPAGVLGSSPDPGSWLAEVSCTLLTRMMAVYAAAARTVVLKSAEDPGARYHERAWTMQEYCGCRRVIVHSETPRNATEAAVQGFRMPSTAEEDHEFEALRTRIRTRMRQALPLWVQRLAEDGTGKGRKARLERARQAQLWGVEMFAQAQARVQCKEPVDKIQALLPMFLNTPVQDLLELLELSHRGAKLAEECRLSEEAKAAMATAKELVRGAFFAEQSLRQHSMV